MEIDSEVPSQNTYSNQIQANNQPADEKKGHNKLLIVVAVIVLFFIVAIPVMLIVTGLSLQVMNSGSGIPETQAKATWKSAAPFGIIDWGFNATGDEFTVILRNNSSQTLLFREMTLASGITFAEDMNVTSGATKTIGLTGTNCNPGEKYSYPKENIEIIYDTTNIKQKTQKAIADIVGTC